MARTRIFNSAQVMAAFILVSAFLLAESRNTRMKRPELKEVPKIGDSIQIPDRWRGIDGIPNTGSGCMVNSAQIDPCFESLIDGVLYTISFRRDNSGSYLVTRVSTDDSKFISPEGLKIGDMITLEDQKDIFEAPYFEVYAKRGERWLPVVGYFGNVGLVSDAVGSKQESLNLEEHLKKHQGPLKLTIYRFIEKRSGN